MIQQKLVLSVVILIGLSKGWLVQRVSSFQSTTSASSKFLLRSRISTLKYRTIMVGDYERHSFLSFPSPLVDHNDCDECDATYYEDITRITISSSIQQEAHRTTTNNNNRNRHSSSDWLYNFRTITNSSILKEIRRPVITLTAWGMFVSSIHTFLKLANRHQLASYMTMPSSVHNFVVSSLGLLLVFRTNSAYQRFLVSCFFILLCVLVEANPSSNHPNHPLYTYRKDVLYGKIYIQWHETYHG
jgi:hypothetical protein